MSDSISRRDWIRGGPAAGIATAFLTASPGESRADQPATKAVLWPGFPRQDLKHVREVVNAAHSDAAKVKELVKAHPALANAWWDWGFGDWESPLGAAAHTGQRGIAEFLLGQGARIDLFATAMLGMTDVVKALVAARPGVQRTLGPHGITLLAHAKAGGKSAADTLAYLESLGDANLGIKVTSLPAERKNLYVGKFASTEADVRLEFRINKGGQLVVDVQVAKAEPVPRFVHYLGGDEFFPAGVPSVRFKFSVTDGKAQSVTIREGEPILLAKRIAT